MSAIVLPEFGPAFDRLKSLVLIMLERSDEFVCGDVLLLDIILKLCVGHIFLFRVVWAV